MAEVPCILFPKITHRRVCAARSSRAEEEMLTLLRRMQTICLLALVLTISVTIAIPSEARDGQTGATAKPQQAPKTAPQVKNALPAYEGQNVTSVELAGQPDADLSALQSLMTQKAGEPFSQAKVDQSIEALKQAGKYQAVEVEFRPEGNGV